MVTAFKRRQQKRSLIVTAFNRKQQKRSLIVMAFRKKTTEEEPDANGF